MEFGIFITFSTILWLNSHNQVVIRGVGKWNTRQNPVTVLRGPPPLSPAPLAGTLTMPSWPPQLIVICVPTASTAVNLVLQRPLVTAGEGSIVYGAPGPRTTRPMTQPEDPAPPGTSAPTEPPTPWNALLVPTIGMAECTQCPAGFFCPQKSETFSSNPCPAGHYCPIGTTHGLQYPCDKGYYNNYTGKGQPSDCIPCEPGRYCGEAGLAYPTAECAEGWYCVRGAWSERPTDYGYSNVSLSCFCPSNATGGECQPGQFCPRGSKEPQPCLAGNYFVHTLC